MSNVSTLEEHVTAIYRCQSWSVYVATPSLHALRVLVEDGSPDLPQLTRAVSPKVLRQELYQSWRTGWWSKHGNVSLGLAQAQPNKLDEALKTI